MLLNLVEGGVWSGSIALLSPSLGPFAEFSLGVAVHIGQIGQLLAACGVRLAVCSAIMTAHLVLKLSERGIPAVWILHEWWPPEMMVEELGKRNDKNTTPDVVAAALAACPRTVCVCRSQLELYKPASGSAVFVGVPSPKANWKAESYSAKLESLGGGGGGGGDPVAKLLGGGPRREPPLATGSGRSPSLPRHRLPAEEPAVDGGGLPRVGGGAHRRAPPRRRRAVPAAYRSSTLRR